MSAYNLPVENPEYEGDADEPTIHVYEVGGYDWNLHFFVGPADPEEAHDELRTVLDKYDEDHTYIGTFEEFGDYIRKVGGRRF